MDGERRRDGDLADMIWGVEEMIAFLSRHDRLPAGDLIFTGTPPRASGRSARATR